MTFGVILALKQNDTTPKAASGTRPPSQALAFFRVLQPGILQIIFLGVIAGADLRLETRDVEGRALKQGKDGLRVLSVRDLERPPSVWVLERKGETGESLVALDSRKGNFVGNEVPRDGDGEAVSAIFRDRWREQEEEGRAVLARKALVREEASRRKQVI